MNSTENLKEQIVNYLRESLIKRSDELKQNILIATESRNSETKSSVGDKYESGREMINIEIEKYNIQLAKSLQLQNHLDNINFQKQFDQVELGSLVFTNYGNYFISIGFGKVELENHSVYCISMASPIGKLLAKKKKDEKIRFQGKEITINKIL